MLKVLFFVNPLFAFSRAFPNKQEGQGESAEDL